MRPFIFQHGRSPWPPGRTAIQIYALIDLERDVEFASLHHGCCEAVKQYPLSMIPDEWLHITLEQVTNADANEIGPEARKEIESSLREHLKDFPTFSVTAGAPLSYGTGVIYDLHPDGQINALHHRVRQAVQAVRGPDSTDYDVLPAHLTAGYAHGEADSDEIQRRLRRVRPGHAPLGIDAVHLLEVEPDHQHKHIRWQHLARIPLADPA